MPQILRLFQAEPGHTEPLQRIEVEEMQLVAGKGIQGHAHFGRTRTRQINILEARFFDWFASSFQRELAHGTTGENIIVEDGLELNWQALGSEFQVGSDAVCALRTYRMPCKVLARQTGVAQAELFVGHVGVFFEVLQSGKIKIGDKIKPL